MRKFYLALLLGLCTYTAQSAIIQGPIVDALTYSTARVTWITDVSSSTVIRYGLTSAYGMTATGRSSVTTHSWYLSGLAPSTTYHFEVCSTAGAETCSSDNSFTTPARPASYLPQPPSRIVDVSMPPGGWGPPFEIAADCSNLSSVVGSLAGLTGNLNYLVRIPVRTECRGQFVFPKRPNHTGWVVVRSAASDSAFPEGVRVTPASTAYMAVFRTDILPAVRGHLNFLNPVCSPDSLYSAFNVTGMSIFICRPQGGTGAAKSISSVTKVPEGLLLNVTAHGYLSGNVVKVTNYAANINASWRIKVVNANQFILEGAPTPASNPGSGTVARMESWTQVPHQLGTALPTSCAVNTWFYKTDKPADQAAYWCTTPNVWTNVRLAVATDWASYGAIQFADGAERYRFIGLEITHNPVPNPPPAGWGQKDYKQGFIGSLLSTKQTNTHVIVDRCDIHGLDYPARLAMGVQLDGSDVALINSRLHKVNRWQTSNDGNNNEGFGINISSGPGPGKIENNFLEAIGITLFFSEAGYHRTPAADYHIRRNYFSHPEKYLAGSPTNVSGKNYTNRHHLELKGGRRMLVEGNIFDTNWADLNQGAFVALSPRPGAVPAPKTITNISYGTVTVSPATAANPYNPGTLVSLAGTWAANHDGIRAVASVPAANVFTLANAPAGAGSTGTSTAVASDVQISDIDIRSNIFRYGPNVLWLIGHEDGTNGILNTKATQRIAFRNNLVHDIDARTASLGGSSSPLSTYTVFSRPGIVGYIARGIEDLTVENNTVHGVQGSAPTFLFFESPQVGANAGLKVQNNIYASSTPMISQINGTYFGTTAFNAAWTAYPAGTSWAAARNVFCCAATAPVIASNPPENSWAATEALIGFTNAGARNYQLLPSSPYSAGKACFGRAGDCTTNGKDAGVDFPQLQSVLGHDERVP
jgi:hypothetical protein